LGVWQDARQLNRECRDVLQRLRAEGQPELAFRLQEDLLSVPATIAEGAARGSDEDFDDFLGRAQSDLVRLASNLYVGVDLAWITESEVGPFLDHIDRLLGRIYALRRSMSQRMEANPAQALTAS
jgi:four helix bundle protein